MWEDLAPDIYRQRLIIEGIYAKNNDKKSINSFMNNLSNELGMTIIYGPIIKDVAGRINKKHKGQECIIIWIESGAQLYTWDNPLFLSLDIYSCKKFNVKNAVTLTKNFFNTNKIVWKEV